MHRIAVLLFCMVSSIKAQGIYNYNSYAASGCGHIQIPNGDYFPHVPWFPYRVHRRFTAINFKCDPGYKLNGPSKAYCQSSNQWTRVPTCEKTTEITCPRPPYVIDASMSSTATTFAVGQSVTYKCRNGFDLVGEGTITCQSNGQFDEKLPYCTRKEVQCVVPEESLKNMIVMTLKLKYEQNELVRFRCSAGYTMVGRSVSVCRFNGYFSNEIPICKRYGCNVMDLNDNVSYSPYKMNYKVNDTIRFSCQGEYELTGSDQATCTDTGSWDSNSPECLLPTKSEEPTLCYLPSDLSKFEIDDPESSYRQGERFVLGCKPGMQPIRRFTFTCTETGEFYPEFPECIPVKCDVPALPENVKVVDAPSRGYYGYGQMIRYECAPGYVFVEGSFDVDMCGDNGLFRSLPPQCKADEKDGDREELYEESVTCELPTLTQGLILTSDVSRSVTEGEVIKYMCMIGYQMTGRHALRCTDSGKFSSAPPTCSLLFTTCDLPDIFSAKDMAPVKDTYQEGEKVSFLCGNNATDKVHFVTCGKNGEFTGELDACKLVQPNYCTLPRIPMFGYAFSRALAKPEIEPGDVVYFRCRDGYKSFGPREIQCQENGEFSPSGAPSCRPQANIEGVAGLKKNAS